MRAPACPRPGTALAWLLAGVLAAAAPAPAANPARLPVAESLEFLTEDVGSANRLDAQGRLVGFGADLVRALCARLGERCAFDVVPWNRAYQRLLREDRIALFSTARIAEREGRMQWVGPLAVAEWSLYQHAADPRRLQRLEDLRALESIGVVRGDAREQFLRELGFDNLVAANRPAYSAQQLALRRIDAWFIDNAALAPVLAEAGLDPKQFREAFVARRICLYLALSTPVPAATVQRWQQALEAMWADGSYARLMEDGGYGRHSVLAHPDIQNDPYCAPGGD
jgi:polar amino acid transport system substrate-binding protein